MKSDILEETLEQPVSEKKNEAVPTQKEEISSSEETPQAHDEKVEAITHWVDKLFSEEQERLSKQGILSAEQWVKNMAAIDKAIAEHPEGTLNFLAQVYGVNVPQKRETKQEYDPKIIQCLRNLEQNQKNLWLALDNQSQQTRQLAINNFASAKDDEGHLLHPHFDQVKNDMFALLDSRIVTDYESAYEKALWLNPQIRSDLLEKQESDKLRSLAEEADKAKAAGFSPKGGQEKEDFSQMTTREILEHTFKKLED